MPKNLVQLNRRIRALEPELRGLQGYLASKLADKGFSSVEWERRWLAEYGALVAATPQKTAGWAWPEESCRWAAGKRQLIEGVI
jgi:hypothetical protein